MDMAGADFGRIDYTVVEGRIVVFEINLNPTFPGIDKDDPRQERRQIVRDRLVEAFARIDTPLPLCKPVNLPLPRPRSHDLPLQTLAGMLRLSPSQLIDPGLGKGR